ncbi:MAG: hypothetical protein ACRDOI_26420 [Trebonia sp.]
MSNSVRSKSSVTAALISATLRSSASVGHSCPQMSMAISRYLQAQAQAFEKPFPADVLDDLGESVPFAADGVSEQVTGRLLKLWIDLHHCPLCACAPTL